MFGSEWWLGFVTGFALVMFLLLMLGLALAAKRDAPSQHADHFEVYTDGTRYRTRAVDDEGNVGPWSEWMTPGGDGGAAHQ